MIWQRLWLWSSSSWEWNWIYSQLSSFCLFAFCSRYGLLNVIVFVIGFLSNLNGGFRGSWAYPFAKAMFVIGTKSQSALRLQCRVLWVFDAGGWLQHGLELCNVGSTNAQKLANGDQASISLVDCCSAIVLETVVFFSLEPNACEVVLFRPASTCIFLKVWPSKFAVL